MEFAPITYHNIYSQDVTGIDTLSVNTCLQFMQMLQYFMTMREVGVEKTQSLTNLRRGEDNNMLFTCNYTDT